MADISIKKSHTVGCEAAIEKLNEFSEDLKSKYGIKSSWNGNVCELKGTGLKKGTVTVTEDNIDIEITLGFLGKAFKSQIETEVEAKFENLFA